MEKKSFKKLQLRKENIAKLNKDEMQNIAGGLPVTAGGTCGRICAIYGPPEPAYNTMVRENCVAPVPMTTRCDSWGGENNYSCARPANYCGTVYVSPTCRVPC